MQEMRSSFVPRYEEKMRKLRLWGIDKNSQVFLDDILPRITNSRAPTSRAGRDSFRDAELPILSKGAKILGFGIQSSVVKREKGEIQ